jgi:ketopantoate reductase
MNFRIAVAIGSYYGGKLAYHGDDVCFLVRSGFEEIKRLGIQVRGMKESFRLAKVRAYKTTEAIGPCDLVLITTQDILQDDSLRLSALGLMDEIIVAAGTCRNDLPANVALEQMKRTETMGAYKPSTLLDFKAGRTLEVEAIWGEPLRRAQAAGASMPRLEQLYAVLKSLNGRRE